MRYLRDDFVTKQPANSGTGAAEARSRQSLGDLREELFVMTRSYVYHPSFVVLDVGGGPILQSGSITNDQSQARDRQILYNFTGRANFLRDKPYQGSVFFEHMNPTLSVAPGQSLTQQNERYGVDMSLLAPATPVPLRLEAARSHNQGRGADRIIDDQTDRFSLRGTRSFGGFGSTVAQYQAAQEQSLSGSPNLPIQGSTSGNQSLNVDTRLALGSNRQYDVTNLMTINRQSYTLENSRLPDRADGRFALDLRGRHTKELSSSAQLNYTSSTQGDLSSTLASVAAGLSYWPSQNVTASVGVRGDDSETRQYSLRTKGIDGSLRYMHALPLGVGQVTYALRRDQREQVATASQTGVIGERVLISGIGFVSLGRQHVSAGSITVSNAARTQTFAEGIDYILSVVGYETRLQRVAGGNILDGQEILVDYSYDVGGSYAYTQTDQTLNLSWGLSSYLTAYVRRYVSAAHLDSGAPTFVLNNIESSAMGVRADVPLRLRMETMLGGNLERENRRETVAPYRREAGELYVDVEDPLFGIGSLRVGLRRTRVDYEQSAAQNTNLRGRELRYTTRWNGLNLFASASAEKDDGGLVPRSRMVGSLKAQWHYRRASLSLSLDRTRETQGDVNRSRSVALLTLRRNF